jgi:hypothetical protein
MSNLRKWAGDFQVGGTASITTLIVGPSGTAISSLGGVNPQTGTSYSLAPSDYAKLVTVSNASPVAVTLTSTLGSTFFCSVSNLGAGTATLTPSSGTIDGQANLALTQYQGVFVYFDGTNWETVRGVGGGGGGSGTVASGTAGQLTWYASSGTTVSGNANATISSGALTLGQPNSVQGQVKFSGATSGTVTLTALAAAGTWTFTLPSNAGSGGQFLQTDGSGNTSWQTAAGGSPTFNNILTGTNTTGQTLTVGSTSSLTFTGTGVVNANQVYGVAVSSTPPTTGQVLTATSATTANWQTPAGGGGSVAGKNVVVGANIASGQSWGSNTSWANYSIFVKLSGSIILTPCNSWNFTMGFTQGTSAVLGNAYLFQAPLNSPAGTTWTQMAQILWGGVGAPTFTLTGESGTAPTFFTTDTISVPLDTTHDWYLVIYFTSAAANSTMGFIEPISSIPYGSGSNIVTGYTTGDQTGTTVVPSMSPISWSLISAVNAVS